MPPTASASRHKRRRPSPEVSVGGSRKVRRRTLRKPRTSSARERSSTSASSPCTIACVSGGIPRSRVPIEPSVSKPRARNASTTRRARSRVWGRALRAVPTTNAEPGGSPRRSRSTRSRSVRVVMKKSEGGRATASSRTAAWRPKVRPPSAGRSALTRIVEAITGASASKTRSSAERRLAASQATRLAATTAAGPQPGSASARTMPATAATSLVAGLNSRPAAGLVGRCEALSVRKAEQLAPGQAGNKQVHGEAGEHLVERVGEQPLLEHGGVQARPSGPECRHEGVGAGARDPAEDVGRDRRRDEGSHDADPEPGCQREDGAEVAPNREAVNGQPREYQQHNAERNP